MAALTRAEARLEALKLAVRPGLETTSILDTAESYYGFIVKEDEPITIEDVVHAAETEQKTEPGMASKAKKAK